MWRYGVGPGLVLIDPAGAEYTYAIRINFASTNKEAEFEALLASLRIVEKIKVRALKVKVDSKLVACQLNGEFVASSEGKAKYLAKAKELAAIFKKFAIENVHRNQNQKAYVLSELYNKVGTRRSMQNAPQSMIGSSEDNAARLVKELVRKVEDQRNEQYGRTPTSQWSCRKSQQVSNARSEGKARPGMSRMGGRTTQYSMGASDHVKDKQWGNS
nr:reverse transcriptase domain-containing protein [Tanacetum cinerariifolium]